MTNLNNTTTDNTTKTVTTGESTTVDSQAVYNNLNLEVLGLCEADYPLVAQRLSEIRSVDSLAVGDLGSATAQHTADYTSDILGLAKAKDTTGGQQLNEVVKVLGQLNSKNVLNKPGFFGRIFGGLKGVKTSFDAQYASTKTQINTMMEEISQSQIGLKARVQMMKQMAVHVEHQHKDLGVFVAAGKLKIYELQTELNDINSRSINDNIASARVFELNTTIVALEKRLSDLQLLQKSAEQTLPMIRIIAGNNLMLINKFESIKAVTIPAWEQQMALAITLEEQRSSVDMVNAVDDATNALLRGNADLLYNNSVDTAKANQRSVIDVDTLKYVQDKLILTVQDTIKASDEGFKKRAEQERGLEELSIRMKTLVTTTVNEANSRRLNQ